jgi:hypothetical protein
MSIKTHINTPLQRSLSVLVNGLVSGLFTLSAAVGYTTPPSLSLKGALGSAEADTPSQNVAHSDLSLRLPVFGYRFESTQGLIMRDLFSGESLEAMEGEQSSLRPNHLEGGGLRLSALQRHSFDLTFKSSESAVSVYYSATRAQRAESLTEQDVLFDHQTLGGRLEVGLLNAFKGVVGYQLVSFGSQWYQGLFNGPTTNEDTMLNASTTSAFPVEGSALKGWSRSELSARLDLSFPTTKTLKLSLGYLNRTFDDQPLVMVSTGEGLDGMGEQDPRRDQLTYAQLTYQGPIGLFEILGTPLLAHVKLNMSIASNSSQQGRIARVVNSERDLIFSSSEDAYSFTRLSAHPSLTVSWGPWVSLSATYLWSSRDFEGRVALDPLKPEGGDKLSDLSTTLDLSLAYRFNTKSSLSLYHRSMSLSSNQVEGEDAFQPLFFPQLMSHSEAYQELGLQVSLLID